MRCLAGGEDGRGLVPADSLLWASALLMAMVPVPVAAQGVVLVQGRVTSSSGSVLEGVRVELEGHAITETSAAGGFRFERVVPGEYSLRIAAVGYVPVVQRLVVRGDTAVTVRLEPIGYRLDSVVVTARTIQVEGRVRDPAGDEVLRYADVFTSQSPPTRTDGHGRFRLKDVWEGTPLALSVAAFGYLPLDTVLIPVDGDRYVFDLRPDTVAQRMIAHQVERIQQRSRGRESVVMRPLDRQALLRSGGGSLLDVLVARYSIHLRRVRCVYVDDRLLPPSMQDEMMGAMNADDAERVEVLFSGVMLRIYTRAFIRRMISGPVELRPLVAPLPCF